MHVFLRAEWNERKMYKKNKKGECGQSDVWGEKADGGDEENSRDQQEENSF